MKRWLRRIWNAILLPPALAGGFLGLAVFRVGDPAQPGAGIGGFLAGWLYGLAVTGLIRLFRVEPCAFPLVGLFCGPVPLASSSSRRTRRRCSTPCAASPTGTVCSRPR